MFSLAFFGRLAPQRRALLEAREFAPLPLLPEVIRQLDALERPGSGDEAAPASRLALIGECFSEIRDLIIRSAKWRVIGALVVLAAVLLSGELVDPEASLVTALAFAVLFLIGKVTEAGIEYFDALRRAQMNRALQAFLIAKVNRKLLYMDPVAALQFSKGELKTLVGPDVDAVEDFVSAAVAQWVPSLVMLVILGPALSYVAGWAGLAALGAALLVLPLSFAGARAMAYFQLRAQKCQDLLAGLVGEWVRNIRLVRYLGWQPSITSRLSATMSGYTRLYAARHVLACAVYALTWAWWMVPVLAMLLFAQRTGTSLSLVELFTSIWLLEQLMNHLQHIPYSISLYGAASASSERLRGLLKSRSLVDHLLPAPTTPVPLGMPTAIHLRNVTLSFGDRKVLGPITTTIGLTARTAVVGEVGSGKTLLLELLAGERAPDEGEIEVHFDSGISAPLWRHDVYTTLRSALAYAAQQPFISNAAVRENIDLGAEAPLATIEDAAGAAELLDDIALFHKRWHEEVGEIGINLSGGQKQRVNLARAFFSRRPIYLLDDPLSAVDSRTEQRLMRAILNRARGLVMVSHRLRELLSCDRLIVLSHGAIVEDDAPAVLLRRPHSMFKRFLEAVADHE